MLPVSTNQEELRDCLKSKLFDDQVPRTTLSQFVLTCNSVESLFHIYTYIALLLAIIQCYLTCVSHI